jgi:predicted transcriptional regulator
LLPNGWKNRLAIGLYKNMIKKRSSSQALSLTLGELELSLLDIIWRNPHLDAREIRSNLNEKKLPSLSTVQSTLERLHKKALVQRCKRSQAYLYSASVSRSDLIGRLMGDVIGSLHDGRLDTILSSFVNAAVSLDDTSLGQLEAMIAEKKQALQEDCDD